MPDGDQNNISGLQIALFSNNCAQSAEPIRLHQRTFSRLSSVLCTPSARQSALINASATKSTTLKSVLLVC
ncbi:hypothetical protein EAF98_09800 [Salmonella enterica]|nr:hypothetical protein [Salmonella enterica]EBX0668521.1 hypothetical protein [Salmonella enterica subsp. enterica serovar Oranienburg]